MDNAIKAVEEIGMTDYCVVPYFPNGNTGNLQWLDLLHKCLQEGDRVLAAKWSTDVEFHSRDGSGKSSSEW